MKTNDAYIRPRYEETDQMGVVYHGNYLTYFEVGRSEFFRALGCPYRILEKKGIFFPVIHAEISYLQPARYDDEIWVRTGIETLKGARVIVRYEIIRKDPEADTVLVRGKTIHGFVNEQMKPINLRKREPELWEILEGCQEER